MLLLKYKIVPMTDYGFPRPLWNNETLGYLLTRPERFPFLPHIRMLYFPEKQIPLPARVAIPRDGFCLFQFELHQFHLIPLTPRFLRAGTAASSAQDFVPHLPHLTAEI